MKKLLLLTLFACLSQLNFAQEKGKFRGGFNLGYAKQTGSGVDGGGVSYNIESNYNIADNMKIGIRHNGAFLIKVFQTNENTSEAKLSGNFGFMGTYDYYFNDGTTSFAPFIGTGLGYINLGNIIINGATLDKYELESKLAGLIRAGFEYGKFRLSVEYNIIPKSTFQNSSAIVKNSYFGVNLGFYLGGGKWKK